MIDLLNYVSLQQFTVLKFATFHKYTLFILINKECLGSNVIYFL